MDDQQKRNRIDAIQRAMRSGSPGSTDEVQRRLRGKFYGQLDAARIADISARLANADAAGRDALRSELTASGLTADELRALGL